ncbi:vWA domain-containing protein [Bacillus sp. EB01]|uniref:vWA domain-containing protein n=1 Tax=Bacillus sp. EB01 TaxID=1347086 RepID=UPI0005C79410|nr:vWA domain-containing protein [Bacillus sp. EB01]
MQIRKFSLLLLILSIAAGIAGTVAGEFILAGLYGAVPSPVLIGIYFGVLALFVGLFALLAELISPVVNGRGWRSEYAGFSWKVLIPATFVLLFLAGTLFQFLYSINLSKTEPPDDIVVALDISGSMLESDPNRKSIKAAQNLISTMKGSHRASVISFNHEAAVTQPMFPISDTGLRTEAVDRIGQLQADGETNIEAALATAMDEINANGESGRKPMVILFSDGYSEVDLPSALKPYKDADIAVNTIGMSRFDIEGSGLLRDISAETGGAYYDVRNADELSNVFETIYLNNADRLLVDERRGPLLDSTWLSVLRVLFYTLIGGLIGLALGAVFDNRYLAKSFTITGIGCGLLAGLLMEAGFRLIPETGIFIRLVSNILLAIVAGFGTLIIPVREKFSGGSLMRRSGNDAERKNFGTQGRHERKGF